MCERVAGSTRRGPLGLFSATGLAGAGGGRAERGEVAGGARRAQPRQHGGLVRLGRGRCLARPAQRPCRRPHREHERQHGTTRGPIAPPAGTDPSDPSPNTLPPNASVSLYTDSLVPRSITITPTTPSYAITSAGARFTRYRERHYTEVGAGPPPLPPRTRYDAFVLSSLLIVFNRADPGHDASIRFDEN